ncbi:MAG: Re/Si-specific NAD(P)(+) transhydrogenase subunit beta [Gammaproteobacteria bacterium]|nr:Re/Si-specific NAD(P)(+) transhydrogenase subunit beta [Gammaproteobacteria bacterium]NND59137.1 Re/Si-specific NAD(P)(+) transhydrogenase subunit beta [Gammaproteobacteria bacterium]
MSGFITAAYISASILFILSLGGLSNQETARRGNLYGMLGMLLAVGATLLSDQVGGYGLIAIAVLIGGSIGWFVASRVEMTAMPQLVAIMHSFVGLAAVLVGFASYLDPDVQYSGIDKTIHEIEIYLGVLIGGVTFTGSVIAFGKLQGTIGSKPLMLPARHWLNIALGVASIYLGFVFVGSADHAAGLVPLSIMTVIAFAFGVHMVMAIGGADMPVVISMLNSYSGWAAAAAGFMLSNDLLIVTGALVGSSGAILSYIMCRAMNRNFFSVIMGGFGASGGSSGVAADQGEAQAVSADEVANMLAGAQNVVIVPGYGMAVAHAQHPVSELTQTLRDRGVNVRFAIHPVAGRMPGHMNVLLAEARVPYDIVLEMDEINEDFADTDVVLVIGANDIVNPSALEDPEGPIAGMPVLEVWHAGTVVVLKRSMATGYAGVQNPLFFRDNTRMLFGDARDSIDNVFRAL